MSALDFLWQAYHEGAAEEFSEWHKGAGAARTGGIGVSFLELYRAMHKVPEQRTVQGQPRETKDSRLVLSDAEMMYFIKHKFDLLSRIDNVLGEWPWETRADDNPSLWPDDYEVADVGSPVAPGRDLQDFQGFIQQTGPGRHFSHVREWPFFLFQLLRKDTWYKCVRYRSGMVGAGSSQLTRMPSTMGSTMPVQPVMGVRPTVLGTPASRSALLPCCSRLCAPCRHRWAAACQWAAACRWAAACQWAVACRWVGCSRACSRATASSSRATASRWAACNEARALDRRVAAAACGDLRIGCHRPARLFSTVTDGNL